MIERLWAGVDTPLNANRLCNYMSLMETSVDADDTVSRFCSVLFSLTVFVSNTTTDLLQHTPPLSLQCGLFLFHLIE